MTIKSDQWIKKMAEGHGMIEPFVEHQVRHSNGNDLISYGNRRSVNCFRQQLTQIK